MSIRIPIISEFDGKGIERAQKEFANLEGAGAKAGFLVKKAFLPAAAAVGGLAVALTDATQAAMEDAAAQAQLALTLRNVTGATDAQVAAVEKSLAAMSMATGIADDQLRPAFEALTRGTKDISVSLQQMSLVTDIATATNRPLVDVADALAKAYEGNFKGLRQLTPEMASLIKEGASMDEIMAVLTGTFGGATKTFAETAQGGFARLSVAIAETKESIGAALLPIVEKALPVLNKFATWASENPKAFLAIAAAIGGVATAIIAVNVAMMLNPFSAIAAGIALLVVAVVAAYNKFEWFRNGVNAVFNFLASGIENFVNGFIGGINLLVKALNFLPGVNIPEIGFRLSLPRLGGAAQQGFADLTSENRGAMGTGFAPPNLAVPQAAIAAAVGGGGGGGGGGGLSVSGAPSASGRLLDNAAGLAAADFFSQGLDNPRVRQEITVNVTGGLATSAEIGQAVVDSIRSYNTVNGPAEILVA